MDTICLNGIWQGKCFGPDGDTNFEFAGTVPGCVHTDLLGSKIPADIYFRDNTDQCSWIEEKDFEYSKHFEIKELPSTAKLVFEGLDVYTDIYLNGIHLGSTDNMFIPHSFDVADKLKLGENHVCVRFYSAVNRVKDIPLCKGSFTRERLHTRRIQCTYGWDWVARFVTCGIWRDVYIDCSEGFGVKDTYIYTDSISKEYATVVVEAEFENFDDGGFTEVVVLSPEGSTVYSHQFFVKEELLKLYVSIPAPSLWYPLGYGEQPLYKLIIGGKEFTFGIRKVEIVELPDEEGSPYYEKCLAIKDSVSGLKYDRNQDFSGFWLVINGIPIVCKGANWVPSEPFPSAESDEKITELLLLAKDANLNMLRVWGGGIFEKPHFYNECDRLGILVTQDFLMACGHYPEDDTAFIAQLQKETAFAARTLRNHPSLVWWSGDNENAVKGSDDATDYWGRTAINQGIFPVLNKLDPHRRFLLSSPYGGTPYASKTKGTTHNTQYLGCSIFPYIMKEDMTDYKEHFSQYLARFIAEEPTLGAVGLPSLKRFMTEEDIFANDEMWNYHTKGNPNLSFSIFDVTCNFAQKVLGQFKDGQDKYFKLKYAQYEWMRITLENVRRNRGFISGIIYWMWNDCWPASSGWALVDYYCLPKASFYGFKRCAKQTVVSITKDQEYEIYLCNEALTDKQVELTVYEIQNGIARQIAKTSVLAAAAQSRKIFTLPEDKLPEGSILVCEITADGVYDRAFYKTGNLSMLPSNAVRIVSQTERSVTVTADKYVHAVELDGEFVFEDNYFSLLPDEVRTVTYRPTKDAKTDTLTVSAYTIE